MREEIRYAAWMMLCEASGHEAVAAACAAEAGWTSSPRSWLALVSKWTSPEFERPLPAWAAALVVRICVPLGARDRLTPIFAREGFEAAQSFEDVRAPKRVPLVKVRSPHRERRERA